MQSQQKNKMKKNCIIVYILNLLDLIFTLVLFQFGAVELNPLLQNPAVMIIVKVIVVGVILYLIAKFPTRIGEIGVKFLIGLYSLVILWHFYCFATVLFLI